MTYDALEQELRAAMLDLQTAEAERLKRALEQVLRRLEAGDTVALIDDLRAILSKT